MAVFGPLVNGVVTINSVVLSARCRNAKWDDAYDQLPAECMGDLAHKAYPGLANGKFACEFLDDLAASGAGSVDATLSALVGTGTPFPVTFKADSGAISTTNPERQANATLAVNPFGGSHGAMLSKSVTFDLCTVTTRDVTP